MESDLTTHVAIESFNRKEDESTSSLSISNEFPKPKKKILLSMEVIAEEKLKDSHESYNSERQKQMVKMFIESESQDTPICPVSSKVQAPRKGNLEEIDKGKGKDQKKRGKAKGVLISNKTKRTSSTKGNKKKTGENEKKDRPFRQDADSKENKKREVCSSKSKCTLMTSNKESEYALSFSSGTNLTQTTFDFGFSKLGPCECSGFRKTSLNNTQTQNGKFVKNKKDKVESKKNLENPSNKSKKKMQKKCSKSKLKAKKKNTKCRKDIKCYQCGKNCESESQNSILEIPNFIVQPFNKFELVLKPRNYKEDERGSLGKVFFMRNLQFWISTKL